MINNLSPKIINDITTDIYQQYNYNNNHWWIKLINKRLWVILWIIVIILSSVSIFFSINNFDYPFTKNPVAITSIIIMISAVFILIQSLVLKFKIHETMIQQLPFLQYYQWILADKSSQLVLEKITDYWEIEPLGNLPLDDQPNYFNYCENVMIGKVNGQSFNYGSIINQKIVYEQGTGYNGAGQIIETTKTSCYYTRFVYYTTRINNHDFDMTLTPRNIFSKKFRNKKQVQLESSVFEDIFEVKTNNQIKLRLVLEPKIMNNLNLLVNDLNHKGLPVIDIKQGQLTLSWKYNLGKNPNISNKGKLLCLPTTVNYEKFITKLLLMLSTDILNLTQSQTWVNNLTL